MANITETVMFTTEKIRRENIKRILREVSEALEEAYISSYKDARNTIQKVERYEIIEELVRAYLEK